MSIVRKVMDLYDRFRHLIHEALKFGLIGALGLVIDLPVYNWLVFDNPMIVGHGGIGMMHSRPLTAKFISVSAATIATYFGNRYWTWRDRGGSSMRREYVMFFVLNAIGLLIAWGCLAFSRYVLDLNSKLADNISANFVGLGLGMLFRFWSYRKFVFTDVLEADRIADEQEHQQYLLTHHRVSADDGSGATKPGPDPDPDPKPAVDRAAG